MKLIFAHDHIFKLTTNGDFYSPGKLNNQSFSRYLSLFSSVTIVSRAENTSDKQAEQYNKIDDKNINFIAFDNQSNLVNRFIKRPYYKRKLKKIISHYDAVVVRLPSEIGFLCAEVALSLNIPYVCEVVACPKDAMKGFNSLKGMLYSPIIVSSMRTYVKKAAGALYVTDSFLQKRYPCLGFSRKASNVEISEVNKLKKSYNIEEKTHIKIVLTGHLDSVHKGYDTAYAAAKFINASLINRKIEFIFIGPGIKFKKVLNLQNVSFNFTGALKPSEVIKCLDNADIYIQPSNQEGLPRATIEAMSRRLPCIVSNAGGLPELIDKRFVHNVNDHTRLANKIIDLISNNALYQEQSDLNALKSERFISNQLTSIRNSFFSQYQKLLLTD